jgi:hypothetical protein
VIRVRDVAGNSDRMRVLAPSRISVGVEVAGECELKVLA